MLIATKWFGTFLADGGRVLKSSLFPKSPEAIAARLFSMQKGHILEEERALAKGRRVNVLESRLTPLGRLVVEDSSFIDPAVFGFRDTLLRESLLLLAELKSRETVGADRHLMEAISSYDSIQEQLNQLDLRLHAWFGLHYPELADILKGMDYSRAILESGDREGIQSSSGFEGPSIGVDFTPGEKEKVISLARAVQHLGGLLEETGAYIDSMSEQELPNLTALLGPKLASRLVREAGGLERIATLPAGTVQLIGAEKALFRHLKKGRKPPKHGLIFQHPLVHSLPREQRGKISRFLASRASIAARLDMFHGRFMGDSLRADVEKRAEKLKNSPAPKRHDARTGKPGHVRRQ